VVGIIDRTREGIINTKWQVNPIATQAVHENERLEGHVLVVDDELLNREYLRKLLSNRGCMVTVAESGESALRLAHDNSPDLFLVDVMMPGMSGYDVSRSLKADARSRDIPVIMVTALAEIEAIEMGFDAGAFDYIRKPFNPRELVARVRNALDLKRSHNALKLWKERMSRELKVAGLLQRKLLSTTPLITPDFEIRMTYRPSMAIGGDVFGAVKLPGGRLCVFVGDVSGHGVGAAMVASLLKVIITEVVLGYGAQGIETVHRKIEERFRRNVTNPEIYATLFLGLYDPDIHVWKCVNCGHPEPLGWMRSNFSGIHPLLGGSTFPVGFDIGDPDRNKFEGDMVVPAMPGTSLMIYTDGLSEACRESREDACGVDGVIAGLSRVMAEDPANVSEGLMDQLIKDGFHLDGDDCTAMIIHCLDPSEVILERWMLPDKEAVTTLARDSETALLAEGWEELAAGAVRLLIQEYGTNIVKHGRPPEGSKIGFQLRRRESACRIWFSDNGREWDSEGQLARKNSVSEDAVQGRGWEMIKTIARRIEVFRQHQENIGCFEVAKNNMDG